MSETLKNIIYTALFFVGFSIPLFMYGQYVDRELDKNRDVFTCIARDRAFNGGTGENCIN